MKENKAERKIHSNSNRKNNKKGKVIETQRRERRKEREKTGRRESMKEREYEGMRENRIAEF